MGSFFDSHLVSLILVTAFHFPLGNCPSPNVGLPTKGQHLSHFKDGHVTQTDPPKHCYPPLDKQTGPSVETWPHSMVRTNQSLGWGLISTLGRKRYQKAHEHCCFVDSTCLRIKRMEENREIMDVNAISSFPARQAHNYWFKILELDVSELRILQMKKVQQSTPWSTLCTPLPGLRPTSP